MKQRYSHWLEETVYDMTDKQEQYITKHGFTIVKPELRPHEDGIVRDIPHSIEWSSKDIAVLSFDRSKGKFNITINRCKLYHSKDVKALKDRLDFLTQMIEELETLD